jgi:general secretion pathway protein B
MSYILEALKKSDQQRQRGATPTLQAAQVTAAAPKRPLFIHYSLFATVLIAAGIMIGWLHPWQTEQAPIETISIDAESRISIPLATAPAPVPSAMPGSTAQEFTVPNLKPVAQPVLAASTKKPNNLALGNSETSSTAVSTLDKSAGRSDVVLGQEAIPMNELPLQIQQELPAMTVQLHAYSSIPSERLVSINSIRLREGGSLMLGLRLEQITPDGMILSYKGYRFQRGIR